MTGTLRFGWMLGLLAVANGALYAMSHGRSIPPRRSLESVPFNLGGWSGKELAALPAPELRVLGADDYLARQYVRGDIGLDLFIAYYRQQRSGDAMHSPRNCLPGSGWAPLLARTIAIPLGGAGAGAFQANDYIVAREDQQQEVIYWYWAAGRMYASEYFGKIYLVWNGITRDRTDGALIRISGPHVQGDPRVHEAMVQLAQDLSSRLPELLRK